MTNDSISKVCSVNGCESKHFGLGLCNMHYKRQRTNGTTDSISKVRRICVVDECGRFRQGNGYCSTHYMRLRRYGTLELQIVSPLEKHTVLWSRVAVTSDDQRCWEWQGQRDKDGYGVISLEGKPCRTHRLAFRITNGRHPNGMVRHICDNPPCCNPNHLLEGTAADNARDMISRNRQAVGIRAGNAKLNNEQVSEIKRRAVKYATGSGKGMPNSQAALAKEFNVSRRVIFLIMNNKGWRHVT